MADLEQTLVSSGCAKIKPSPPAWQREGLHFAKVALRRGKGSNGPAMKRSVSSTVRLATASSRIAASLIAFALPALLAADNEPPAGFVPLFNGKDFSNWKVPDGDNGHWKIIDGVIDYDASSEVERRQEPRGPSGSSATSCCRSTGASRRRRTSIRMSPTSCRTARTRATFAARR